MAEKKVYIGSFGPILYDDSNAIDDADGDFTGEDQKGLVTDGDVLIGGDATFTGSIEAETVGIEDSDGSHHLTFKWNEDDSADRTLNFLVSGGNRSLTLSGNLTVEAASLINQDLTTDSTTAALAGLTLGTGELTCGSINRASGSLTLEIGGVAQATVATTSLTVTPTLLLSTCVDAGTDTDKFLVLDGSNNVDYRTGAEVLSDIGAASVVTFAAVNAALAAANADIDINNQDLENVNQLAVGFTSPTYDIELRSAADYNVTAFRVYSDTATHRPYLYFTKSHTDTPWSIVETIDNEYLGDITWFGVSTSPAFAEAASVYAMQAGAAAGAYVPAELIFKVSGSASLSDTMKLTATELYLEDGVNYGSHDSDETMYFGRAVIGWQGAGNEAALMHRALALDGTNYAIKQLNLGDTYLNCSAGKQIYFRRNNATVTTLDDLDDLTDGGETALHSHAAGANDVTAATNITDHAIVRGDGGAKGVQEAATATIDDDGIVTLSGQSGCLVTLSANQDIPSGVNTQVQFDTEGYDTQNEFNTITHTFTASTAGKYLVSILVLTAESVNIQDIVLAMIYKNDALETFNAITSARNGTVTVRLTAVVDVSINDTIEGWFYHDYGANREINSALCQMAIQKIS